MRHIDTLPSNNNIEQKPSLNPLVVAERVFAIAVLSLAIYSTYVEIRSPGTLKKLLEGVGQVLGGNKPPGGDVSNGVDIPLRPPVKPLATKDIGPGASLTPAASATTWDKLITPRVTNTFVPDLTQTATATPGKDDEKTPASDAAVAELKAVIDAQKKSANMPGTEISELRMKLKFFERVVDVPASKDLRPDYSKMPLIPGTNDRLYIAASAPIESIGGVPVTDKYAIYGICDKETKMCYLITGASNEGAGTFTNTSNNYLKDNKESVDFSIHVDGKLADLTKFQGETTWSQLVSGAPEEFSVGGRTYFLPFFGGLSGK